MQFPKAPFEEPLTYVFDLDGVIYRGAEQQPHAAKTVLALKSRGHIVRYYTNNSSLSREAYSARLDSFGIPAPIDEIMTSSYAAALYFMETNAIGKTVYQIGQEGVTHELEAVGMRVIKDMDEPDAHIDYVVVGIDRAFTYDKLARAQSAILAGAKFIATNEDMTFPTEGGAVSPGNGCLVAAVRASTSVEPFVVGKPHEYALLKILELTNTPRERAIIVGDNLATDIAVGNRAGIHTVLVLTGLTSSEEAAKATGDMKPERVIETLAELIS
jgi:4-nitrophenyl phosphatase